MNEDEIERIKHMIKKRVSDIFYMYNTQISIGYSRYSKDAQNIEELLKIADKRMYKDKFSRRKQLL